MLDPSRQVRSLIDSLPIGTLEQPSFRSGREKGEYATKDADCEPPYFDPTLLADDLEKIATEMKPILKPVSRLVDNPELFMKAAGGVLRPEGPTFSEPSGRRTRGKIALSWFHSDLAPMISG